MDLSCAELSLHVSPPAIPLQRVRFDDQMDSFLSQPALCNIVNYLFRQQLFAERVESDELSCQEPGIKKSLCHKHDFADQLKIGDHHSTGSREEQLQLSGLLTMLLPSHSPRGLPQVSSVTSSQLLQFPLLGSPAPDWGPCAATG